VILCGDLGGTKSDLALFPLVPPFEPVATAKFRSGDFGTACDVVDAFLARHPADVTIACLGVPGPVIGGRAEATNLPWVIDAAVLRERLGGCPVVLLNDLEAFAWGLPALGEGCFTVVQAGAANATGNAAVIAAGTGLGQAGMYWDGQRHRPFASEGGHSEFGPRSEREMNLLRYLLARYGGHVSWERVVSGPGLLNLFGFLRDVEGDPVPAELAGCDDAEAISSAALAGGPSIAVEALALFVHFYGAEAGNLALKLKATGGVYLGGGIAPRIVPKLVDGTFAASFADKGRFRSLLETIPIRVVLEPRAALWGAARCALETLGRV
jgi:glucokinase